MPMGWVRFFSPSYILLSFLPKGFQCHSWNKPCVFPDHTGWPHYQTSRNSWQSATPCQGQTHRSKWQNCESGPSRRNLCCGILTAERVSEHQCSKDNTCSCHLDSYWNDEEQTQSVMRKDEDDTLWMHTGDEGIMDEDGYLRGAYYRFTFLSLILNPASTSCWTDKGKS